MKKNNISDPVIPRILNYLRVSQQLEKENVATVSSGDMAQLTNTTASQIRKDLSNFGKFGQPRVGYNVSRLKFYLQEIMDGKGMCNLALVGVGNLGAALLNYKGFERDGLTIVSAFDKEAGKIGKQFGNVCVEHIDSIKESVVKNNVHIGIIAVPVDSAQQVADKLIEAGILSILNFAPTIITFPGEITLRNVDFSNELKALRFFTLHR